MLASEARPWGLTYLTTPSRGNVWGFGIIRTSPPGHRELIVMADATFFDAPTAASLKKHRIVSKYFGGWANIVLPNALKREGKIIHLNLYSVPCHYPHRTPP